MSPRCQCLTKAASGSMCAAMRTVGRYAGQTFRPKPIPPLGPRNNQKNQSFPVSLVRALHLQAGVIASLQTQGRVASQQARVVWSTQTDRRKQDRREKPMTFGIQICIRPWIPRSPPTDNI